MEAHAEHPFAASARRRVRVVVVASRLDGEDLPILGMLFHRTPPSAIAATLRMDAPWLTPRRWAMLDRLIGASARSPSPRLHPSGRA